jgi:hypothetical protein
VEVERTEDPFVAKARAVLAENLSEPGFSVRDWADLLHMDEPLIGHAQSENNAKQIH